MAVNAKRKSHWKNSLDEWATPVLANMLWALLSVTIIGLPVAFAGLIAVIFHWIDDRRTQVFSVFFRTIRATWLKCYLLFALDLLIGGFLLLNLFIFQLMDMGDVLAFLSRSVTLFAIIMYFIANIPAWVLVATWDAPLKGILSFSLRIIFVEPMWTIIMAVAVAVTSFVSLVMPAGLLVFGTGAIVAYVACRGTYFIISRHMSRAEFQILDVI